MAKETPKYQRILLKLSGEALMGNQQFGIDRPWSGLLQFEKKFGALVDPGAEDADLGGGGEPVVIEVVRGGLGQQDGADPDRLYVEHLAHANDPLPTGERTIVATTVSDNQPSVLLAIYEQAGPVLSPELPANIPLTNGSGVISGIPPTSCRRTGP